MSTKTFFKRAALVVVASLGLGFLSVPSSQAGVATASLTLGSATATANVSDSATGSWVLRFTADSAAGDTAVVKYSCDAPTGASCPAIQARQTATADTANIQTFAGRNGGATPASAPWVDISGNYWGESATATANVNVRSSVSFKAVNFTKAGTYTYTFFVAGGLAGTTISGTTVNWVVTVSAVSTGASSVISYFGLNDAQASYWRATPSGTFNATSTDSAVVLDKGTAASPALAGVLYLVPTTLAGDTRVAVGDTFVPIQDTFVVTMSGPGYVSVAGAAPTGKAVAALNVSAYALGAAYKTESLTVWSDGTAGTGTITITKGSATVYTKSVTFTGVAASASTSLSDTYTSIGQTLNLVAQVKDAGGNLLTSGTFYVFSSDTKVVSAGASLYSNAATQYQTLGQCASATWSTTAKTLTCSLTTADTGTASIYLADSWNVTASSFVTTPLTLTVTGNTIASATVAFDKATYAPGERAVITITTKDSAGRVQATGATGTLGAILQTPTLTGVTALPYAGTVAGGADQTGLTSVTKYMDSGVETRVVLMPNYGSDVSYSLVYATFGSTTGEKTTVTATAKVVDPTQAAQNVAIANAQAAADAATDAALQAIDAANAATDAANLAAEAADAATVAAQESKDAADAATAAVESLATQVATLMAALQAQITSLANVVAKIAKKVKA